MRGTLTPALVEERLEALKVLPAKAEKLLSDHAEIQYFASQFFSHKDVYFIGRNLDYMLALEGSLKLKEVSYIHSEAYPAGIETRHNLPH